MKLNNVKVKNLKPRDKRYKTPDGCGLSVWVYPNGSKYWRFKYRYGGKEKSLAVGVYPEVSLAQARAATQDAKALLRSGLDPVAEKLKAKRQQDTALGQSFEKVARKWWDAKRGGWKSSHAQKVLKSLERDVFPYIGDRPLSQIDAPEVLSVARRIEARNALDVAARAIGRISSVFVWAIQSGVATDNPAGNLKGVIKQRKTEHHKAIPRDELPDLLCAIDNYHGYPPTKYALQLLMLTFVRTNELRHARWCEFDFKAKLWRIPADRMKGGLDHLVPLSSQALEILEALRPYSGHAEHVFLGQRGAYKVMSENTMLYALYSMGFKGKVTGHGMRATASSTLNENGFHSDAIERQLAHIERNKVRGAYTHQADFMQERRRMMQWWAEYLVAQRANGNLYQEDFIPRMSRRHKNLTNSYS